MSLKLLLSLFPAFLIVLAGVPSTAQIQDEMGVPSVEEGLPGDSMQDDSMQDDSMQVEPVPEPEPSVEPSITPDSPSVAEPTGSPIGGAEPSGPSGPNSLVQCGPGGAASVVTKIPAGCRVLGVNSPPGQLTNAESP